MISELEIEGIFVRKHNKEIKTSYNGSLLFNRDQINIIMLKIKIEESHYARLFLKLWCQTKIERRAQRSSKTCEICIKLP